MNSLELVAGLPLPSNPQGDRTAEEPKVGIQSFKKTNTWTEDVGQQ